MIIDSHSHLPSREAITNLQPGQIPESGFFYSAGIHPWDAEKADEAVFEWLQCVALSPQVVAIGECGIDLAVSTPLQTQTNIFIKMILLSESVNKPLIVHCVRGWQILMDIYRITERQTPWIIHGFRGKPQLAQQLTKHGFYLSYGKHFNPESLRVTPAAQLLIESDTGNIDDTIKAVSSALNFTGNELKGIVMENNLRLFG